MEKEIYEMLLLYYQSNEAINQLRLDMSINGNEKYYLTQINNEVRNKELAKKFILTNFHLVNKRDVA